MVAPTLGYVSSTPGLTSDKMLVFPADSLLPLFLSNVIEFTRSGLAPPAGPPPAGMPALAPRPYSVASSAFLPYFLSPCYLLKTGGSVEDGWRQVSPLAFLLTGAALTRILDALIDVGLLLTPVSTPDDLVAAVDLARSRIPMPADGTAHPLALSLGDLDRVVDPFTVTLVPLLIMPPQPDIAPNAVGRGRGRGGVPPPPPPVPPPVVGVPMAQVDLRPDPGPGLSPLRWLSLVSIAALEDCTRARPLEALARILHILGPCSTFDSRRDEMSAVAAGAEALALGVRRQLGHVGAVASVDAAMALHLPGHLVALMGAFPACYRRVPYSTAQARARHVMECDFVFGRDADRERVEILCVDDIAMTAPNLMVLIGRCPSQGERRTAIRSLATLYLGNAALREPIHQLLQATEAEVTARRHVYTHFLDAANATFADILMFLRERHIAETTPTSGSDRDSTGRFGSDSRPAMGGDVTLSAPAVKQLSLAAIQAAVRMPSFCTAYTALQATNMDTDSGRMDALNICFRSSSTLIHRYLHFGETSLEARHPLFGLVRCALGAIGLYLGQAIVVRAGRAIPRALEFFSWGAAEDSLNDDNSRSKQTLRFAGVCSQRTLFLQNKLARMDMVNAPGGFLAVDAIRDGTVATFVSLDQHYKLIAAFEGFQSFIGSVYLACGYPRQSSNGHTWHTLIDVFLEYLKEGRTLAGAAREAHLNLCDSCFRTALRKIDEAASRRLTEANPGEAPFTFILPFDSDGVIQLSQRLALREEATAFRLALGINAADIAPVVLEGSRESRTTWSRTDRARLGDGDEREGRSRRTERGGREDRDRGGGRDRGEGRTHPPRRADSPHPGRLDESDSPSRSASRERVPAKPLAPPAGRLVTWNKDRTTFVIGRAGPGLTQTLFDAKAIAAHCQVPLASKCWPYLVSTKTGEARLSVCDGTGPDHVGHTGCAHVPPAGWDGDAVRANPLWVKRTVTAGKRVPRGDLRSTSRSRSPSKERKARD